MLTCCLSPRGSCSGHAVRSRDVPSAVRVSHSPVRSVSWPGSHELALAAQACWSGGLLPCPRGLSPGLEAVSRPWWCRPAGAGAFCPCPWGLYLHRRRQEHLALGRSARGRPCAGASARTPVCAFLVSLPRGKPALWPWCPASGLQLQAPSWLVG